MTTHPQLPTHLCTQAQPLSHCSRATASTSATAATATAICLMVSSWRCQVTLKLVTQAVAQQHL